MSFTTRRLLSDSASQYRIPNSLRFRSSASAYLRRTPAVAGNRTTWTWSGWVKRGAFGIFQNLFSAINSVGSTTEIAFNANNTLSFVWNSYNTITTNAVFRDTSSWYHLVFVWNTSNLTPANRVVIYVNGTLQVVTASYPPINTLSFWNTAMSNQIGTYSSGSYLFDGYLAEVNFIDGQALDPLAFGYFSPKTGVWTPSRYTGTYGTNGFYLKFTDTSSNTATGIGKDFSGNGNNWTPNNISLTAGATYDSMIDTPTPYDDGGYGRGNYAVGNPLDCMTVSASPAPLVAYLASGNLLQLNAGGLPVSGLGPFARTNMYVSSDKWYAEMTVTNNLQAVPSSAGSYTGALGIARPSDTTTIPSNYIVWHSNGNIYNGIAGTTTAFSTATVLAGTVFGFLLDLTMGTLVMYRNNVLQGTMATGLTGAWTFTSGGYGGQFAYNFGQRPFAYTPPTGFKTLCTQNLPTPAIVNPAQFMAATTYAGTGATQTIANTVNNRSFQPDFVWIKGRSAATDHALYDSVRGATKDLVSNSTAAETTQATGLTTFGSTGFSIGNLAKLNTNAQTYVAWQWKAGDSTVTNTDGTITSQVDANPTAGFSIVSYTGNGANSATVGHGLGTAPSMIIAKITSSSILYSWRDWVVYHKQVGATRTLYLNSDSASFDGSGNAPWNDTEPTSSVFSVANFTGAGVNGNGDSFIAYCFAEVDGFSKFGRYTGNGSTDGPFLYCGFRPKWMMFKRTDVAGTLWAILDSGRDALNVVSGYVNPNNSAVEFTQAAVDFTSNGIKIRNVGTGANISGSTYIFAAFAEAPFKYALAR